jgi:threonylcarbamoyladenosine tRNA methylthiotransferase MtaB
MRHGYVKKRNTFSIKTLGCKLNQYESECLRYNLEKMGYEFRGFSETADFYIINTCSVTAKTDSRSRNAIRRARRKAPNSIIVATGCYVESAPDELRKMKELDYVTGNKFKNEIPYLFEKISKNKIDRNISFKEIIKNKTPLESGIDIFHGHSRAFIKIQEGCDAFCSYCIIPYTRGRSRSIQSSKVIDQVKRLAKNGCEEIVLTGIHIGRYGENSNASTDLVALIRMILDSTVGIRIRLSSIEPTEVTNELIQLVSGTDRIASHFHIPLQSGDDVILKAMNRPYSVKEYIEKTKEIAEYIPDAAIGSDIIVGFPGETEENFNNTRAVLESELPVNYFHVFSYSDRPGTAAKILPGKVPPKTRKKRSRELIELGKVKKKNFMLSQIGRNEIALIEGEYEGDKKLQKSITGNYCEVIVQADSNLRGRLVPVRITGDRNGYLYGELVGGAILGK